MSGFDSFTSDQHDLLVALPYRVGLWVSNSDTAGGEDSDVIEMQALSDIVTGFAEDFLKSEFVQTLMEETVSRRAEWDSWSGHLEDVPGECTRAAELLSERLDRKELASFKMTLMEIATSVAMAYREFDGSADFAHRLSVYSHVLVEKIRTLMTGRARQSNEELFNISKAERKALDALIHALDLGHLRRATGVVNAGEDI